MIIIAIVEDDDICAKTLQEYIEKYGTENNVACEIVHFKSGWEFINDYRSVFDIVFMDIEMPDLDGMETAKELRNMDEHVCLIFVTNMAKYAINGYEVNAQDFMVKPVGYFNLSLKLDKAIRSVKKRKAGEIVIPYEDGIKRFFADDIFYIEVIKHNVLYHTDTGVYSIRSSMTREEEKFKELGFAKCNSCYLVNFKYVSQIKGNFVYVGSEQLQMSRARKKDFINKFTAYLGSRGGVDDSIRFCFRLYYKNFRLTVIRRNSSICVFSEKAQFVLGAFSCFACGFLCVLLFFTAADGG